MYMHLKRTPAEEHERARRRAYKAAKRAAKRKRASDGHSRNTHDDEPHKLDYDAIRAELEFKEKMWGALEEDERLDGINARFNDYGHIPDRWSRDAHDAANPQYMDDDEYAEWIRQGMWKKKHAREYEEQARRDAERAAKRAREKQVRAETSHIEGLAREQEERRARERKRQREEEYRRRYEQQWKALSDPHSRDQRPLTMGDIPWPLFSTEYKGFESGRLRVEDITPEAITTFLLPNANGVSTSARSDDATRPSRDKLKETLLRFHPDKFEGRFMHRVTASDTESVREAIEQIARILNILMSEQS